MSADNSWLNSISSAGTVDKLMKGTSGALHSSWFCVSHNAKCSYVASSFKEGEILISK